MIFVADENIEFYVVSALRKIGYEVEYIAEMAAGATDSNILQNAYLENKVLLTHDKDFGDLVFRDKMSHSGIVLVRLKDTMPITEKIKIVCNAFQQHMKQFQNAFSVIDENFVRIRAAR